MSKSNRKYKTSEWRGKVLFDARRSIQKKRPQPSKKLFEKLYDKPKKVVFKEDANPNKFFALRKSDLLTETTASTIGIYIALCCLSDFKTDREVQVSIENIGVYTGLTDWSTIKSGLDELVGLGLITGEKIINKRRYWVYSTDFIRSSELQNYKANEWVPFYSCIVETGVWAKLTPKAQSLYLTLRALSKFDLDSTEFDYNDFIEGGPDFEDYYRNRQFEVYMSSWAELARNSNIHYTSLKSLITQLEKLGLVSKADWTSSCYLNVYFRPLEYQEYWREW